jgi:hypothetical protein
LHGCYDGCTNIQRPSDRFAWAARKSGDRVIGRDPLRVRYAFLDKSFLVLAEHMDLDPLLAIKMRSLYIRPWHLCQPAFKAGARTGSEVFRLRRQPSMIHSRKQVKKFGSIFPNNYGPELSVSSTLSHGSKNVLLVAIKSTPKP